MPSTFGLLEEKDTAGLAAAAAAVGCSLRLSLPTDRQKFRLESDPIQPANDPTGAATQQNGSAPPSQCFLCTRGSSLSVVCMRRRWRALRFAVGLRWRRPYLFVFLLRSTPTAGGGSDPIVSWWNLGTLRQRMQGCWEVFHSSIIPSFAHSLIRVLIHSGLRLIVHYRFIQSTSTHPCGHSYVRPFIYSFVHHLSIHSFIQFFILSLIRSSFFPFTYPSNDSLVPSCVDSFNSFIHSSHLFSRVLPLSAAAPRLFMGTEESVRLFMGG